MHAVCRLSAVFVHVMASLPSPSTEWHNLHFQSCRPQRRPAAKRRAVSKALADMSTSDMALDTNAREANGHASMAHADMAIKKFADTDVPETDMAEADVAQADMAQADMADAVTANGDRAPATDAAPSSAEKPKRKYVKSGKFVGKYNSWKQKQDQGQNGTAETPPDGGNHQPCCLYSIHSMTLPSLAMPA